MLAATLGALLVLVLLAGYLLPLIGSLLEKSYEVSSEGVYVLTESRWTRVKLDGYFWSPPDNGGYIVYFNNLRCPACRAFDPTWEDFAKKYGRENFTLVEVVCTWFAISCSDPTARATFNAYSIYQSPTLMVIYNMTILYKGVPPTAADEIFKLFNEAITFYRNASLAVAGE
ncbi:MAG: protein disulfide isomerase family protein [Fervidicoccaceae archaeon]